MYEEKSLTPVSMHPIDDVRMETADNGVIICYTQKKKTGKGKYDNYSYDYKKEVFDFDDEEDSKEAFDRFKELFMAMKKSKK